MSLLATQAVKWANAGRYVVPFLKNIALCDASEASLDKEKTKKLFETFPESDGIGLVTGVDKGIVAVLLNEQQQKEYLRKTGRTIFDDTVCFSIANKLLAMFIPTENMKASICERFFNGESCLVYRMDRSITRVGTNNVAAMFPENIFIPEIKCFSVGESIIALREADAKDFVETVCEIFFFLGKNLLEKEKDILFSACEDFSEEKFNFFKTLAIQSFEAGKDDANADFSLCGGIKL